MTGWSSTTARSWPTPISPDGSHLAALTTDGGIALTIVDLKNWKVQQLVGSSSAANLKISGDDVGQQGPTYSPDGKTLWVPRTNGYSRFPVNADGTVSAPTAINIPKDGSKSALPAQAVFSADGSTVYATVNGQNRIQAIDAATGALGQSWAVGNAPRGILRVGTKLYVSNEGGRTATASDTTINSYGTQVPANPNTGATTTGTVSVIDLADPTAAVKSIDVGLHPTDAVRQERGAVRHQHRQRHRLGHQHQQRHGRPDHRHAAVAGGHRRVRAGRRHPHRRRPPAGDPRPGQRGRRVQVHQCAAAGPATSVCCLPTISRPPSTQVGGQIVVGNTRGIDAARPDSNGHNTHDTTSSLTRFKLPSDHDTAGYTDKVFQYNGWTNGSVQLAKGKKAKPVAVPANIGDPSTIKHVFLLVKENRTYDQVFGDMPQGNGDPSLTQFGENVTPDQHALAEQFGLYDNFYDPPHELRRGAQLADAGRRPGVHRVVRR